jgi:hypothetical protein
MARKEKAGTRVPTVAPEVGAEVVAAKPDPDARTVEQQIEDEQVGFITRLRRRALDEGRIADACRERFGIGRSRVHRLLQVVLYAARQEVDSNRPFARAEQILRLRNSLSSLHAQLAEEMARQKVDPKTKKPVSATDNWAIVRISSEIRQTEDLLADVEGNRAPTEIQVFGEVRESLQVVLTNLSPEKTKELLLRAQIRRNALIELGGKETT